MKGEKFMAISYTYPRVDVNTTALTRRILTETVDDTISMLSIFNSKGGPVDTITRIHGISQFESIYGSLDDDMLGNTGLNIKNWLSNGGTVYAMRHIPSENSIESYGIDVDDIIRGQRAYSEISDEIHNENIKDAVIFRKYDYCNTYSNFISNPDSPFYSDSGQNVSIGLYILTYRNESTSESGRKYFPVYFINDNESLLNSMPFSLYEGPTGNRYKTYYISVPLTQDYDVLAESNFINAGIPFKVGEEDRTNIVMGKNQYRKWLKDEENPNKYQLKNPISDINSLKKYFEDYFQNDTAANLYADYILLPEWMAVTTKLDGTDESTDGISNFEFTGVTDDPDERFEISNIAYEIDSETVDVLDNIVWSLIEKDQNIYDIQTGKFMLREPFIYDTSLQTKDAIKSILVGSAAAVENTKYGTSRRFILEDYRVNGFVISLEAVSLLPGYYSISDSSDKYYSSSLKEPKMLYILENKSPESTGENSSPESTNIDGSNFHAVVDSEYATAIPKSATEDEDVPYKHFNISAFCNRIPLIYNPRVVSKNPGSLYNNLKLSFYRKSSTSSIYKLFLGEAVIENQEISGYYDLIGINNSISDNIYIDMDFDINNDVWHTYFEHMSQLLASASGEYIYNQYFSQGDNGGYTVKITKAGVESLYANKLTTIENPLAIGSQISLSFYNGTDMYIDRVDPEKLDETIQSLTIYSALKSENTRKLLMNTLEYPIDIFFDAGYSAKAKKAIYEAFCSIPTSEDFIRSDVNVILDSFFINDRMGNPTRVIHSTAEDYVSGSQLIGDFLPRTSNTKNLSVYEQYFKIALNNTQIVVSPTYFLSKNIAYYDISLGYGTHAPIAGMKRGLIENYKYINKQYLPDSAQELFESDVNYATVYRNGTAFMSQRTREDDSQNTALQFFNNSFTTNRIVKELERIARAYLFEYNDAVSISNLRKALNQYIGRHVSDRVLTYAMLDVQRDIYNSEQINIVLNIKFNNSVEVIEVNLVIE